MRGVSWLDVDDPAQAHYRIEHRADCVGKRPAVYYRDWVSEIASASDKARPVCLVLEFADGRSVHDEKVSCPYGSLVIRTLSAGGKQGAELSDKFGLYK